MADNHLQMLHLQLNTLAVFRDLLVQPLFARFLCYAQQKEDLAKRLNLYAAFVEEIYRLGGDLGDAVQALLFENENIYVTALAQGRAVDANIEACVTRELAILSEFSALTSADFQADLAFDAALPTFSTQKTDLTAAYTARMRAINKYGYGIFSTCGMFRLSDLGDRRIEPIVSSDPITLDSFIGYHAEREQVLENTRAFVQGRPAANVLLYGDAGTGKSSTVKAVANHFYRDGIRLIEIRKDQMSRLPFVMEKISHNPLKFIIFIDDLSFNRNDDTFSMLKAALEGSASAKAANAVIYATSNRRHIVRECFDEREGSDVHRNDTMQELLSLSARFGLTVQFGKPDKKLYLEIVRELAEKKQVQMNIQELETRAEAFALRRGHRSARCAEQFIDSLI